jgi:hypothetical protein
MFSKHTRRIEEIGRGREAISPVMLACHTDDDGQTTWRTGQPISCRLGTCGMYERYDSNRARSYSHEFPLLETIEIMW